VAIAIHSDQGRNIVPARTVNVGSFVLILINTNTPIEYIDHGRTECCSNMHQY